MSVSGYTPVSPFAPASLAEHEQSVGLPGQVLWSPFSEAMSLGDQGELDRTTTEALLAELADDEFGDAVAALAGEAAGRHLRSPGIWSAESAAPVPTDTAAGEYMESVAAQADRMLAELEAYFGSRSVDSLRDEEIATVTGRDYMETSSPLDAQEQFLNKLLDKAKKAARGVAKLAKRGLTAVGKFLPLGQLFGLLRKLVRPLLERVLKQAMGRLPASVRPLAKQLASRLTGEAADPQHDASEVFDRQLAQLMLSPNATEADQMLAAYASDGPQRSLQERC